MTVELAWVGAPTATSAWVRTKVTGASVRIAVSTSSDLSAPVFYGPETPTAEGVASVVLTGLSPSTRYWWEVEEDSSLSGVSGQLVTHPASGSHASFRFGIFGDTGGDLVGEPTEFVSDFVSNRPSIDTVRERALAQDWLFVGCLGDLHYRDLGSASHGHPEFDVAAYRQAYDDVATWDGMLGTDARMGKLMRDVPWVYAWDDHDYGPNNSDSTAPGRLNALQVYRERVPHYPLGLGASPAPIDQQFQVGRVQFLLSDVRSQKVGADDHSQEQLDWYRSVLESSTAEVLMWLHTIPWVNSTAQRDTIQAMLVDTGWADRMVMISCDMHALALDDGTNNPVDGADWPRAVFAALDAASAGGSGTWTLGPNGGRDRWGEVAITDLSSVIVVEMTGYVGPTEVMSLQFARETSTAPPSFAGDMAELVYGSHRATFEARVLDTFQTGDDPDGEVIKINDGSVTFDATAEIFATLDLTTDGMNERRRSRFPRVASDLLAPYGREIFVRRGIDIGSEIVWVPLGYFRLDDAEQADASDQPIRLSGSDRMAGIIDGRLITPRQYTSGQSIAEVVSDLVGDIYPSATIVFDDDSGAQDLGRQLLVEEDRYAALLDVAESLGKVVLWDSEGFLRIENAPDPDNITWEVKSGHFGVLASADRRATREGMANAVVARGEGGDTQNPVQGIAVDAGANSPTRWFPPDDPVQLWFGQVPHFYSSPLLTTVGGAQSAATALLRRRVGMNYQVDWGSVVNPALRPRDVIRLTHKDGTRELHDVETMMVPLSWDRNMTGSTREKALVQISLVHPATLRGR